MPGARRIDQREIDAAGKIGKHIRLAARRPHLNIARAGARDALMDRRKLPLVDVGGVNLTAIFGHRRQRQRLAAGAGGEIDDLFAGLGAGESSAASCEPSSWISIVALEKGGLGVDGGIFRVRRKPDAAARAATIASARRCRCASFGNTSSRSALSVLTRRSSGARLASAAPSAARSSPKTREKCGSSHSG